MSLARELERNSHIQIMIPSVTSVGKELPLDRWTEHVLKLVLPFSGGATEIAAQGHWLDRGGRLVTEEVRILDVYLPRLLSTSESEALAIELLRLAALMEQDALGVVIGERLFLVVPESSCVR